MFIQHLYEQLPDEVKQKVSCALITRYVFEGDPPFLPPVLSKIRKNKDLVGHEIAVTLHALRILAYDHHIKDEETLEKFWQKEMNTGEVKQLTRLQRIKKFLFKRT